MNDGTSVGEKWPIFASPRGERNSTLTVRLSWRAGSKQIGVTYAGWLDWDGCHGAFDGRARA